jgi:beta-lactam-binding protein with PASTA domain
MVLGLCAALYVIFFSSLSLITQHGAEVKVPSVAGRDLRSAEKTLRAYGFDVVVDSSYDPGKKAFAVLNQQPEPGSVVKDGRTIFLTVNKAEPPTTPMPNLVNLSFRSASLIIKSNRLILGDTTYRPDIAAGAVLEQLFRGKTIAPGTSIPQGSRIDLVIGDGLGNVEFNVPDVIGMSFYEGRETLSGNGLHATPVFDADVTDTASAIIYNQTLAPFNEGGAPNRIREGDYVDIYIKQHPTQEEMDRNRNPSTSVNSADSSRPF